MEKYDFLRPAEQELVERIKSNHPDDKDVQNLLDRFLEERRADEDIIRRCDHCGKPMKEGYYLAGEYACCDECCLALYDGDRETMEEDLSHAEEPDGECYYTEWEDYNSYNS